MSIHTKQCLYQVLGVDNSSTTEEIKKAYRKKAIEQHPDKNPDNVTLATTKFKQIQEAQEILSDKNERLQYDELKEQILRSNFDQDNFNSNTEKNGGEYEEINLYQYFLFSNYSNVQEENSSQNSFFSFYQKAFDEILNLEILSQNNSTSSSPYPKNFGNIDSDWEYVENFYDLWKLFSTKRKFVYRDVQRLKDAENRRIRREMQSINEKERVKARREYNELVLHLIDFIQRRDCRQKLVQKHRNLEKLKQKKNKLKQRDSYKIKNSEKKQDFLDKEELRLEQQRHREHMEREQQNQYGVDEQSKDHLDNTNINVQESTNTLSDGSSESNEDDNDLYTCVLCNKYFKTNQQKLNHEKSKKHKSVVAFEMSLLSETLEDEVDCREIKFDNEKGSESQDKILHAEQSKIETSEIKTLKQSKRKQKSKLKKPDFGDILIDSETSLNLNNENDEDKPLKQSSNKDEKIKTRRRRRKKKDNDKHFRNNDKNDLVNESHSTSKNLHECFECHQVFTSRSKIFRHLREYPGHARLKIIDNDFNNRKSNKKVLK